MKLILKVLKEIGLE